MLRRGLALPLILGLLSSTGVASGTPCCTLSHLAEPAALASADCCDSPDCCRAEERGPVQASLTAKPPEASSCPTLAVVLPSLPDAHQAAMLASGGPLQLREHSPPPHLRDTRLLISLFRI
jgi:hypothetical protein